VKEKSAAKCEFGALERGRKKLAGGFGNGT